MFEFHGWARIESTSGRREWRSDGLYAPDDDELYVRLKEELQKLNSSSRECMQIHFGQLVSLTVSGAQNHRDESIFHIFRWLATNGKRSNGVLFTRDPEDGDRDYDVDTHFRVFRLCRGEFVELEDLFEMPPNPRWPPVENVFPGSPDQE
jgi:hypothetical protein